MNRVVGILIPVVAAPAGFMLVRSAADALVLEPTFFAVFYWKNSLAFALGVLAIFLLVFYRLLQAYRPLASDGGGGRFSRAILLGLGLGMLAAAIFAGRVNRPVPLAWFEPRAHADLKPLALAHGDKPVHSHRGDAPDQIQGGKLVKLDGLARAHARKLKRPILYYFRADWCPNCPEFERYMLGSPVFAPALKNFVLVKMDVTDFDKLKAYVDYKYGVHGTPTVVFRDRGGRIVSGATVNGAHVSYRLFGRLLETVGRSNGGRSEGEKVGR